MATFLYLLIYILISGLLALLYLSGFLHTIGFIRLVDQALARFTPVWLLTACNQRLPKWVCYVCCALYHALVLGCHALAIIDILPLTDQELVDSKFNHPAIMYHAWAVHTLLYLLCALTDPGVVNKINYKRAGDNAWYKSETRCSTCDIIKPARSKHCSVCDVCVLRFDHHCLWIHCCIGANNYRYFVGVVLSAIVMTANGSALCYLALCSVYSLQRLGAYRYLAPDGTPKQLEGIILVQNYPRIFLLGASLVLLTVLLSLFASYHFYLILSNKTTNESYKSPPLINENGKLFYDKGLMANVTEVLLPGTVSRTPASVTTKATE